MTRLILDLDCSAEHDDLDQMARSMARSIEHELGYTVRGVRIEDDANETTETELEEAQRILYGPRQANYGPPEQDFARTAKIWTGILMLKLQKGVEIAPEDVALCMMGVKMSREAHKAARDNRTDMIGYAACLCRVVAARTGK